MGLRVKAGSERGMAKQGQRMAGHRKKGIGPDEERGHTWPQAGPPVTWVLIILKTPPPLLRWAAGGSWRSKGGGGSEQMTRTDCLVAPILRSHGTEGKPFLAGLPPHPSHDPCNPSPDAWLSHPQPWGGWGPGNNASLDELQ